MPDPSWFVAVHERLLEGDPVAPAELITAVFDSLVLHLRKKHPGVDDLELLYDSVTDALFAYVKEPRKFDPSKRGLFGYLQMSAERDLLNLLAKRDRRGYREEVVDDVELLAPDGNIELEILARLDAERLREEIAQLFPDPRDRRVVDLMIDGERSTEAFVETLELGGESMIEQRRQVKRAKDRVKKMVVRHFRRSGS